MRGPSNVRYHTAYVLQHFAKEGFLVTVFFLVAPTCVFFSGKMENQVVLFFRAAMLYVCYQVLYIYKVFHGVLRCLTLQRSVFFVAPRNLNARASKQASARRRRQSA